jgi:hypothetical protein
MRARAQNLAIMLSTVTHTVISPGLLGVFCAQRIYVTSVTFLSPLRAISAK